MPFDPVSMVPGAAPPASDPAGLAVHLRLSGDALERKRRALLYQQSQVMPLPSRLCDQVCGAW